MKLQDARDFYYFHSGKTSDLIRQLGLGGIAVVVTDPATDKLLLGQGLDAIGNSQEEFAKLYAAEIDTWAKVVKSVGMSPK